MSSLLDEVVCHEKAIDASDARPDLGAIYVRAAGVCVESVGSNGELCCATHSEGLD